ncbi:hypothetical protein P154DRAFT_56234 [Amniculicola lignicola CBS 123094]|uniref:Uncharacterized protein n=1 Tax=Amniculicola lignicola CBS 123094 TaxID=1392246 RepID=A0A6A5WTQ4_9PLEO|nr:hypothetical protein P154DRAFT_56234 [Amniculicola lignicola CBS 123094]
MGWIKSYGLGGGCGLSFFQLNIGKHEHTVTALVFYGRSRIVMSNVPICISVLVSSYGLKHR